MTTLRITLEGLGARQLYRVCRYAWDRNNTARGNRFALERDDRTKTKDGLIDFLLAHFSYETLTDAIANTSDEDHEPQQQAIPMPEPIPAPAITPVSTPVQQTPMTATNDPTAAAKHLAAALAAMMPGNAPVDADQVRAIVQAELATLPAREIIIKTEQTAIKVEGHVHPQFEKVCKLIGQGINVLLVGPAGCGKTHLAHMVATALGRPFGSVSYSAGASESWLLGRLLPTGDGGKFEYQRSRFCELYEQPSVFLHDELDGADPNMLLTLNSALANGGFDNPVNGARLTRNAQAAQVASANTFGTGAGAMYVGRAQLDAATLDRWYIIEMDYDREYEKQLAPRHVTDYVWSLREKTQAAKVRRVISTRAIQKAAGALAAGIDWDEVKPDLTRGWTADELAKVR